MPRSEEEGINTSESPSAIVDDFVEINPIDDTSVEANTEEVKENTYAKESAKDTVARIFKESQAKDQTGDQGQNQEKGQTVANKNQVGSKPELAEGIDPELLPPERLNSQQRQLFQNLPVGLKRGLHKTIKDLERGQTQLLGQYKAQYERATNESKGLVEAINPYLSKWGDIGMTATQVIVGLASAHDKLNNPETSQSAYLQLGQQLGHVDEQGRFLGSQNVGNSNNQNINLANNPYVKELEQKIISLQSKVDPIYNNHEQEFNKTVSSITAEMQSVRDEVDPNTGNFVYPELQNEEYLKMLSPRISAIVASAPNVSYADALRQANAKTREELFGVTTTQTQIRPTAPRPTFNNNVRAIEAAQTVRGRISPSLNTSSTNGTPPPEALKDARSTTAWVIQQALLNQRR